MKTNEVRRKLNAGEPVLGTFMGLGSPTVAELLSHAGLDFLVIETEHNGMDMAENQQMLMAMSGSDVAPLIRLPSGDPVFIQRALDIGAVGIFVPMLRTAEQARAVVAATRYPPSGHRGFGPLRASHYTFDYPDYLRRGNDNTLVGFLLETREAIDNLEEIVAVAGVDVLMVGMWDMCLDFGLDPLEMPHAEIDRVVERALEVCAAAGVGLGAGASRPEDLPALQERGFTFLAYGPDYAPLRGAAEAGVAAFRSSAGKRGSEIS